MYIAREQEQTIYPVCFRRVLQYGKELNVEDNEMRLLVKRISKWEYADKWVKTVGTLDCGR